MKISPETNWAASGTAIASNEDTDEQRVIKIRNRCIEISDNHPIRVWDKAGNPLGTFTPEYFLGLNEEQQLRFVAVSKRMHNTGVDRL